MMGKKFLFGILAIACLSATAIKLNYPPDLYKVCFLGVVGLFMAGQTVVDTMKKKNGG